MKKISFKTVAFLSATAVLTASCQREETLDMRRNEVSFTVATGYENGPATRTEYSGERYMVGSTSYERIDWVAGDVIRIASDKAATSDGASYADYTVQSASPESEKSIAGVSSSAPLTWGGGTNTFYGLYPAPGADGVDSGVSFTEAGVATLVLPADQSSITMKYAYMGAATTASAGESVSLEFNPLMNAYCFRLLGDADTGMKLKSLTISSSDSYLAAPSYTVELDASDNSFGSVTYTEGTASKSITATFGGGDGVDLPTSGTPFTHTFFALPENQTNLSLTLTFIEGTTELTKSFELTGLSVFPGQKVNIMSSNISVPEAWEYTLGSLLSVTMEYTGGQGTLASTFVSYRTSSSGAVEPVPFTFQYSTDDGENWTEGLPEWFGVDSPTSFNGSVFGETLALEMSAQEVSFAEDVHRQALYNAPRRDDFDLSTINVATGSIQDSRSTANCYVVQAPGTYRFPLVYGNGLLMGKVNSDAYTGSSGTNNLVTFLDHMDTGITSPYIAVQQSGKELAACLVWTDEPNLVSDVRLNGSGENAFISFSVSQSSICQGNALIAVLANGEIAWSWHIWVTDADLTDLQPGMNNYEFPAVNLGWCDGKTATFPARSCLVRAVQPEAMGVKTTAVRVSQNDEIVQDLGDSPYYQWGRKDPMPAASNFSTTNKVYYPSVESYAFSTSTVNNKRVTIGTSIKNPNIYYRYQSGTYWTSAVYHNLWNSSRKANPIKTIYDPSPYGFKIPPRVAWSSLSTVWEKVNDVYGGRKAGDLFFPASGVRNNQGNLVNIGTYGYYISADVTSNNAYSLSFYESKITYDTSSYRNYAFSVRPVFDTYSVETYTGADSDGMDVSILDMDNNNGNWN